MAEESTTQKPLEILVADDESGILQLFSAFFGMNGANVVTASDGLDAISKYTARFKAGDPFDAVVTDLNMPGASGAEVTKKVKELSPATQVIAITGYEATKEYEALTKSLGEQRPEGILPKPITLEDIEHLVSMIRYVREVRVEQPGYRLEPPLYNRVA